MKKFTSVLSALAFSFALIPPLPMSVAHACTQTNNVGGNDSTQNCSSSTLRRTTIKTDYYANVFISNTHTASSRLTISSGDDIEGVIGTAGAPLNKVRETMVFNNTDIVVEDPTPTSTTPVIQTNSDDDTTQNATTTDEFIEEATSTAVLLWLETETTSAENDVVVAAADDIENSSFTTAPGAQNDVVKERAGNLFRFLRTKLGSIIISL